MSEEPEVISGTSDADIAAEARAVAKVKQVSNPPIDGGVFTLCGVDVTVPPLKAKHLVKHSANMLAISKLASTAGQETSPDTFLKLALPIIHASLTRNYPALTSDDVMELLDIAVLPLVVSAVMGQSGYKKAKAGE